ncbi:unnamed protein product [Cyclocybe aegerita]|uniref:Uncharacterized protein n=1 Tax=Cyclocybe aegerita TaxID=1973307 RepID=A0A8S0XJF3_CYCAE|nr:unnamed protein product [Cyclocybe aegerita]
MYSAAWRFRFIQAAISQRYFGMHFRRRIGRVVVLYSDLQVLVLNISIHILGFKLQESRLIFVRVFLYCGVDSFVISNSCRALPSISCFDPEKLQDAFASR